MPFEPGAGLGPFRINGHLGSGGMGEVYAATDTRLHRQVALKVLPAAATADTPRRERLHREARIISALHHPHICTLYDIGRDEDVDYLVLELLTGETLQARLRRGALPVADAIRIGSETASALASAHRNGVVHRDLKPANVMLTRDGVKLLDFGLAKELTLAPAHAETLTGTALATAEGMLAGTLPYMAPEQVQGHPADARSDLFALGLVLHEMVTGRRVFEGSNQASLIAHILDHDPPALHTQVPLAPAALSHVVHGCLAKDPDERWQSAYDVHRELEWLRSSPSPSTAPRAQPLWKTWAPWALAAATLFAAGGSLLPRAGPTPVAPRLHLKIDLPDAALEVFDVPELSPDGGRIAYTAARKGHRQLYVLNLATHASTPLPGTNGATFPFWAPDGQHLGFFADGFLRRVGIGGGLVQTLAPAQIGSGAAWAADTIVFAPTRGGSLQRVAPQDGVPENLTATLEDGSLRPPTLLLPSLLPDGEHYLAVSLGGNAQNQGAGIYLGSLREARVSRLMPIFSPWTRAAAGHLLYVQGRRLLARPLDVGAGRVAGPDRVVVEDPVGPFSTLPDGTIAYVAPPPLRSLTWVDRQGATAPAFGEPAAYSGVTLSSRDDRAAIWKSDDNGNIDLWEIDTSTGIMSRLTSAPAMDADAAWSPDGRRLAFTSSRGGQNGVYLKDLDSGTEAVLHTGAAAMVVDGWTPDGRHVLARTLGREVFLIPLEGDKRPRMIADTPYREDELHVSPDGRWVTFNSNESGAWEIYVAAFPSFTAKRQVSRGGGVQALWRGDGREIFYLAPDGGMMSVAIDTTRGPHTSAPVRLFATNAEPISQTPQYAVTQDGRRFLVLDRGPAQPTVVHVLLNWFSQPSS